jgi:hypothetical protein
MPRDRRSRPHAVLILLTIAFGASALSCAGAGRVLKEQYEYEEELYLALDGSATLNVNASVASLVALRGADLPVDPRARVDRNTVKSLYEVPGAAAIVSLARRNGRRFVHVSVDVDNVQTLARIAPLAWSTYTLAREGESVEFRQVVGAAARKPVNDVGWTGDEVVAFRLHVPSRIEFHNAPSGRIERGNILEWEQPLTDRLNGTPIELRVQMQPQSILASTLLLFGSMIVAAAIVFAVVIWWVARRGAEPEAARSRS